MIRITCRAALAAASAAKAQAQARGKADRKPLVVLAHRVHKTVAAPRGGVDVTAAFAKATGVAVQWITLHTSPLAEPLMREGSQPETGMDVGFLVNTQVVPRVATLFELLGMQVARQQVGMPVRHASSGLHYNAAILAERGAEPPATIEQMIEGARKCSVRREDGARVVGLVMPGVTPLLD